MTIESLDKLEAQEAKATEGDWFAAVQKPDALFTWLMNRTGTAGRFTITDAEFIAALRNSASDLFGLAREALKKREKAQIKHAYSPTSICDCKTILHGGNFCPDCGKEIEWKD